MNGIISCDSASNYYVVETVRDFDGVAVKLYGVACESGDVTLSIPDLSESKERIQRLVDCMNNGRLQVEHFKNVIEDFLFDNDMELLNHL